MRISYDDECNQAFPMVLVQLDPGKRLCASHDGQPFICERVHGSDVCRPMYSEPNEDWHALIIAWLDHETHKKFVGVEDIRWRAMIAAEKLCAPNAPLPDYGARVVVQAVKGIGVRFPNALCYHAVRINADGTAGWVYRTDQRAWAEREATRQAEIWKVPLVNKLPVVHKPRVNFIPMDDA